MDPEVPLQGFFLRFQSARRLTRSTSHESPACERRSRSARAAHLSLGLILVRALPSSAFSAGRFAFLWESVPPLVHHHGDGAVGAAGHSLFQAQVKKDVVVGYPCLGKMISWSK